MVGLRTLRGASKSITRLLFRKDGTLYTIDVRVAVPLPVLDITMKKAFANLAVKWYDV